MRVEAARWQLEEGEGGGKRIIRLVLITRPRINPAAADTRARRPRLARARDRARPPRFPSEADEILVRAAEATCRRCRFSFKAKTPLDRFLQRSPRHWRLRTALPNNDEFFSPARVARRGERMARY